MTRRRQSLVRWTLPVATLLCLWFYAASGWRSTRLAGSWQRDFVALRSGCVMVYRARPGPSQPAFFVPPWTWGFRSEDLHGAQVTYIPMWLVVLPLIAATCWAWRPRSPAGLQRRLRWLSAVAAGSALVLSAASVGCTVECLHPAIPGRVSLHAGRVGLQRDGAVNHGELTAQWRRWSAWKWGPTLEAGTTAPGNWSIAVPVWMLLVPAAAAAVVAWRNRAPPTACRWCEYDRTGLQHDTLCPECGHSPANS